MNNQNTNELPDFVTFGIYLLLSIAVFGFGKWFLNAIDPIIERTDYVEECLEFYNYNACNYVSFHPQYKPLLPLENQILKTEAQLDSIRQKSIKAYKNGNYENAFSNAAEYLHYFPEDQEVFDVMYESAEKMFWMNQNK